MRRHSQINVRQHSLGDLVIADEDDMDGARLRITVRRQAGNGLGVLISILSPFALSQAFTVVGYR